MDYLILALAILLAPFLPLIAVPLFFWVRAKHAKVEAKGGLTGNEVAKRILARHGVTDVDVASTGELMGDHYDPAKKRVCLTSQVGNGKSVYAYAVAAHECGHALQHNQGYRFLTWWVAVAPIVFFINLIVQVLVTLLAGIWIEVLWALPFSYGLMFLLSVLSLPNEIDASRRGLRFLDELGLRADEVEKRQMRTVLIAAALTYVAKAISDLFYALFYAFVAANSKSR